MSLASTESAQPSPLPLFCELSRHKCHPESAFFPFSLSRPAGRRKGFFFFSPFSKRMNCCQKYDAEPPSPFHKGQDVPLQKLRLILPSLPPLPGSYIVELFLFPLFSSFFRGSKKKFQRAPLLPFPFRPAADPV